LRENPQITTQQSSKMSVSQNKKVDSEIIHIGLGGMPQAVEFLLCKELKPKMKNKKIKERHCSH
jgi:hypothetical protein